VIPLNRSSGTRYLHDARSFEKLTSAGLTFLDADGCGIVPGVASV
jgi:hypothetical protein